jgi:hypothetical protein
MIFWDVTKEQVRVKQLFKFAWMYARTLVSRINRSNSFSTSVLFMEIGKYWFITDKSGLSPVPIKRYFDSHKEIESYLVVLCVLCSLDLKLTQSTASMLLSVEIIIRETLGIVSQKLISVFLIIMFIMYQQASYCM